MEVRIAIVLDIFVIFFSLGAVWIVVGQAGSQFPTGYNAFDVSSMVGANNGGQQVKPPSYHQSTFVAYTQAGLPPQIVGNLALDAAIVAIPATLLLAFFSLARWRLSLPAGILGVVGGALWTLATPAIAKQAAGRLAAWQGFNGVGTQVSVGSSLGPDIAMAGGALLLITYFMTVKEKLDPPLNSDLPNPLSS